MLYAAWAMMRHARCHGHSHHPAPERALSKSRKGALFFLFTLGLTPCVGVLPVIVTAAASGKAAVFLTWVAFSLGVLLALMSATLLARVGIMRLDHPLFEHYGDVITGCGISLLGLILFFFPLGPH
jgi:ABC-type nickel/cobalt efflux system permease component RcnA